jgi:hypothetical protein
MNKTPSEAIESEEKEEHIENLVLDLLKGEIVPLGRNEFEYRTYTLHEDVIACIDPEKYSQLVCELVRGFVTKDYNLILKSTASIAELFQSEGEVFVKVKI